MKQFILIILATVWLIPKSNGQLFALSANPSAEKPVHYSFNLPDRHRTPFYFGQETKVGIGISGSGILIGCAGIGLYNTYSGRSDNNNNQQSIQLSIGIWLVGGFLGILGSAFAIDGSIHDYHRYYRQEYFSLISNKPNEVGFAFNFR